MIGLASFSDPRKTELEELREAYVARCHANLKKRLVEAGFEVFDANQGVFGSKEFRSIKDLESALAAASALAKARCSGVVVGCWHWTETRLVEVLVEEVKKPVLLYAEKDPRWAGSTCIAAVGASLWENLALAAVHHERAQGGLDFVVKWCRSVEAIERLKKSRLMLFGGTYALGMTHLVDDFAALKKLIGEVVFVDQYVLVQKAEDILKSDPKRVGKFLRWLKEGGAYVEFDGKMLTEEILRKQAALYLAAKDVVADVEGDVGVSVKCQPELSELYGVDACLIPAFLPFGEDFEGRKSVVPTVCEGDVKGLVTCMLLYYLSGEPPLFGDVKYVGDGFFLLANCGASSVYYAALSEDASENLPKLSLLPQCQGKGGAAVTYRTPSTEVTVARLARVRGKYVMQYLVSEALEFTEELESVLSWGKTWPHTAIRLRIPSDLFLRVLASNHLSAVPGNWQEELELACKLVNVETLDLGDEQACKDFLKKLS